MLIGQAEFVGKQDAVYTAGLECLQFFVGLGYSLLNGAACRKQGVAWQLPKMQQRND